jgi:Na+/proline symporter
MRLPNTQDLENADDGNVGAIVLVISVLVSDVIGALTVAYDLLVGAIFVPVVGALFWRRATGAGALASTVVGGLTVMALSWSGTASWQTARSTAASSRASLPSW